jgi:hypothetical protein
MKPRIGLPSLAIGDEVLFKPRQYALNAEYADQVMRGGCGTECHGRSSVSESFSNLSLFRPAANRQYDDSPRHDECAKSHTDCEEEHCHQVVNDHEVY